MKLLGSLAVLIACLGIGRAPLQAARSELRCLDGLCRALRAMREELSRSLCPLETLLATAAGLTGGAARGFFEQAARGVERLQEQSFFDSWRAACALLTALGAPERQALEDLGLSLGRAGLADQLAALDRCLGALEGAAAALRARLPERRRLSLALGAAAGIFLCLLIL